jgi:uncharacterized membrane protein
MRVKKFLTALEHQRVHDAIKNAEARTSGDIVIYIAHRRVEYPLTTAHDKFSQLRLEKAEAKNSLLILVAPRSQTFAVVGGTALHEKVGQKWWEELSALLHHHFKEGRYTDGLVAAIERAGHALQTHFPAGNVDRTGQQDIIED